MNINDVTKPTGYIPDPDRYKKMNYRRCGRSGILLPEISLGLWHNFGHASNLVEGRKILRRAFDLGITHFDLANNYGPPYGAAEENFGLLLKKDFLPYRDELLISSKAGYDMWEGPYGNYGSRKYLIASLDQSLKRMGLDYVDIFYHHRPDPDTPLEETMGALDQIIRSGKALYAGISNYPAETSSRAIKILRDQKTPFIIHQARYSIFDRWVEKGLTSVLDSEDIGLIAFSPLAQGLLSDRYLDGIPEGSRAAKDLAYLGPDDVNAKIESIKKLNKIAESRSQTLSQMAISWLLSMKHVTSVLVGVSSVNQLENNYNALNNTSFTTEELDRINKIAS